MASRRPSNAVAVAPQEMTSRNASSEPAATISLSSSVVGAPTSVAPTTSSEPAVYKLSGTGGKAKSTVDGKESSMKHFEDFLATKHMPTFADLTEDELCDITMWQEFGTYLCDFAQNRRTNDLLKWGTAKQYISGPKSNAWDRTKGNLIWKDETWYTKIRADIEKTIVKRCIEAGVPAEDKSEPLGRDSLLLLFSTSIRELKQQETTRLFPRSARHGADCGAACCRATQCTHAAASTVANDDV